MDIDKEIEELEKIIVDRLDTARAYCGNQLCDAGRWVAEGIVPKYRKADAVRKEILRGIDQLAAQCGLDEFRAVHLRKYAKQLGVEVDE